MRSRVASFVLMTSILTSVGLSAAPAYAFGDASDCPAPGTEWMPAVVGVAVEQGTQAVEVPTGISNIGGAGLVNAPAGSPLNAPAASPLNAPAKFTG